MVGRGVVGRVHQKNPTVNHGLYMEYNHGLFMVKPSIFQKSFFLPVNHEHFWGSSIYNTLVYLSFLW